MRHFDCLDSSIEAWEGGRPDIPTFPKDEETD